MRNHLLAALAVVALASPAIGAGAPSLGSPLAALGAPAIDPADSNAMLGFASVLGGSQRRDINLACEAIIAAPASYDGGSLAYCTSLRVAESLAPRINRDAN